MKHGRGRFGFFMFIFWGFILKTCFIDGCERPARTRGWCHTHYYRWYRTGDPGAAALLRSSRPDHCIVVDCDKPVHGCGLCNMHYRRKQRTGEIGDATPRIGKACWSTDITYNGAHSRVRRARNNASMYPCADNCGQQAEEWSYRHGSPHEMTERVTNRHGNEYVYAYSPDPADYDPLCKPCHTRYDSERIAV